MKWSNERGVNGLTDLERYPDLIRLGLDINNKNGTKEKNDYEGTRR